MFIYVFFQITSGKICFQTSCLCWGVSVASTG